MFTALLSLLLFLLLTFSTHAHTASTAYLQVSVTNTTATLQLEIPLRDLDDALGLDPNDDGQLTWGELRHQESNLAAFVCAGLKLSAGSQNLPLNLADLQVSERLDSPCAVLHLRTPLPPHTTALTLDYRLLFDRDPLHRCLVAGISAPTVLAPERIRVELPLNVGDTPSFSLATFIREGVHHIWTGYDHLAFLFALLLPAVLRRTAEGWRPATDFRTVLGEVVKVVTAFTLAHSLTLGLAAFGLIRLPSRWVEATIAASIVVAAGMTFARFKPAASPQTKPRRAWLVAFSFGLIHGFGFAGVLGELGLSREHLALPLFGFNAGVELGQLACVLLFLPLAYALRHTRFYRQGALPFGSAAIALLAGGWLIERSFNLSFMPF